MPFDPEAVMRFKQVTVALLGIAAAALGIWVVGLFGDFFEENPIFSPVMLSNALGIDVLGALAPIIAGLVALLVFLKTAKNPLKKFALAFLASLVFAFLLSHATPDGLAGYPLLFALISGIAVAAVNVYPKPFFNLKKNFIFSVTLILACVPLSLFLVDLAYVPSFYGGIIGGNGLTDGVLLSTLYAPLAVTGIFFALSYVSQMVLLRKKSQATSRN